MIGDPSELWLRIGKTLWHVQIAEYSLVHFAVANRLPNHFSQEEADSLFESQFKPTVGVLLGNLRQAKLISSAADVAISIFVAERNWLAHHIRRLNNADIYNQARYEALLTRLDALKESSDSISRGVTLWLEKWGEKKGVSKEDIETETKNILERLRQGDG